MRPTLRFALPLLGFALLLTLLAAALTDSPRAAQARAPLVGQPAPDFSLARLDDPARRIARNDLLGRPWLLNAWASWCSACADEHAALLALARTPGVRLVGLNVKDSHADAEAWLALRGNPYEATLFDADGRVGLDFGVVAVPETFVIDSHGVVRHRVRGPLTAELLRARIAPLLKELDGQPQAR